MKQQLAVECFGGRWSLMRVIRLVVIGGCTSNEVLFWFRIATYLHKRGWAQYAAYLLRRLQRIYGCYFNPFAEIGTGLKLPHPTGIVIGKGVVIGENCMVYQQVTIGGARKGDYHTGNYPIIGDNVIIFAGAKVIGNVRIGDNCVIGANAVVTRDIPANSKAVGVPARPIVNTL